METSTNAYSIRPMNSEDIKQLAAIYVRAYKDSDESWNENSAKRLLSYWYEIQPDLAFLAECGSTPVGGFIVAIKPWWDGNHLIDGELFVDPEFQHCGIGQELICTVLKIAKVKYAPVFWETWTFRNQDFPLTWYKRIGFEEIEEWIMLRAPVERVLCEC